MHLSQASNAVASIQSLKNRLVRQEDPDLEQVQRSEREMCALGAEQSSNEAWLEFIVRRQQSGDVISRRDWSFVLDKTRAAYIRCRSWQDSVKSTPVASLLRALKALIEARYERSPGQEFPDDVRLASIFSGWLGLKRKPLSNPVNREDLLELLGQVIDQVEITTTYDRGADYVAEVLLGEVREARLVDAEALHEALSPYGAAICRLAARGIATARAPRRSWVWALAEERDIEGVMVNRPGMESAEFEAGDVRLSVCANRFSTTAVLSIDDRGVRVATETMELERWVDAFLTGVDVRSIRRHESTWTLQSGRVDIDLPTKDVEAIKEVLMQYTRSAKLAEHRGRMLEEWGEI